MSAQQMLVAGTVLWLERWEVRLEAQDVQGKRPQEFDVRPCV